MRPPQGPAGIEPGPQPQPQPQPAGPAAVAAAAWYTGRLGALRRDEAGGQREHIRLGYLRLAFGLAVLLLLFPPVPFFLFALAAFALAARLHGRVLRWLAETRRAIAWCEDGLARLEDRWQGIRSRRTPVDVSQSLYAVDLDLFGAGSLFDLLCEARTAGGEATLAQWLLHSAERDTILERQAAVAELAAKPSLRERFARAPGLAVAMLDSARVLAWAEDAENSPRGRLPTALQWIAPLLVLCTLAGGWRYAATRSPVLLVAALLADGALTFGLQKRFRPLFPKIEQMSRTLGTASALLAAIEQEEFTAPRNVALQRRLREAGTPPSRALRRLASLTQWTEAHGSYVIRILDTPLLYSLQLALQVQRWRDRFGGALKDWLEVHAEMEALVSLAAFGFENPGHVFPTITEGPATFNAVGLGHPLLPRRTCVTNDVFLSSTDPMLLISGSNMSGKSTLLRSVGVNAVLALAGAPVRAQSLSLSVLAVAASIQLGDSLQAGRSRFYAEILRLRAIVELARTNPPALFLVDEVLAGTNSSDRLQGAQGLVRTLLRSGAIGLLSTHDLALTNIRTAEGGSEDLVRNAHFQDEVAEGQLLFDYTLRDGPVMRSNGVDLMRLIGLDIG